MLESPDHGPMLTWAWETSLPPHGGMVPLAGWDWSTIAAKDTLRGTTWTSHSYEAIGTWDGTTFTLTDAPLPGSAPLGEPRQFGRLSSRSATRSP